MVVLDYQKKKNLILLIQRHAQFWFFRKGSETSSPRHFVNNFSRKILLTLYSVNWPNFIFWLSLLLEILGYMCIIIICFPVYDAINFEIILSFFNHAVFYMIKNSKQKFKYLNADLKISLYVWIRLKIISWKFCILNPYKSRVIYPRSLCFA